MAVISGADYLVVQQDLANARDTQLLAKDDLFDAVYKIVMLQSINPEVDMLNEFWQTYLGNSQLVTATTLLLGAVDSLQNHVIQRGNFDTVDEYLWNYVWPQKVDPTFQALSADAGYTISDMYVDLP